jgi:hypothetical protein
MSKMDNLRAMREARYEQARSRAGTSASERATPRPTMPAPTGSPATAQARAQATAPGPSDDLPDAEAALCGHRNMGGRTCTREAGHAAKSHRYA